MLSDYANIIAPIIAIINSVIAVSVSHFKPERQSLKIALLVVSIVLGLGAATGTIYGQYIVVTKMETDAVKRTEIHKRLGELIAQGDALLFILRDPTKPLM
jgi:phosphate/sulfate permease